MLPPGDILQAPHVHAVKPLSKSVEAAHKYLIQAILIICYMATFNWNVVQRHIDYRTVTAKKTDTGLNTDTH